jgi:hypothetical protein
VQLSYNVTIPDLVAMNIHNFHHAPAFQRQQRNGRIIAAVITAVASFTLAYFLDRDKQLSLVAFIVPLIGGIAIYLYYPKLIESTLRKRLTTYLSEGNNKGMLGEQTLILTPDMVVCTSSNGESRAAWKDIDNIYITEQHVFIVVNPMQAITIPKHSINDQIYNDLVQTIRQYHKPAANSTVH